MQVTVFGVGYVGLVSGVGFANLGHDVICVDNNKDKVAQLQKGIPTIYEAGLAELLGKSIREGRISFTTDAAQGVRKSEVIFLALPTPSLGDGRADQSALHHVADSIGTYMNGYKVIVNKSTAPVGTLKRLQSLIYKKTTHPFDMVSNPEFLKEGTAVSDFLRPDRVVIGAESESVIEKMKSLYRPLLLNGHPIVAMDIVSAEITKYAANCMLATRIALMNQLANLCDALGGDISSVREGLSHDVRIGSKFLHAGVGYGGSCFPKDVRSLIHIGQDAGVNISIVEAVNDCNEKQWSIFLQKIKRSFQGNLDGKTIAVWGLSFKPHTDDVREAPALLLIKAMLAEGAHIRAHDPIAIGNAKALLPGEVVFGDNMYETAHGTDALVLVTEWPEYNNPDYARLATVMRGRTLFDGRNTLNVKEAIQNGFTYQGVGKKK